MAAGTTTSNIIGTLSDEETNFLRTAYLIIHVCPKAIRTLFDKHHPPAVLTTQLVAQQSTLKKCKGIFKSNWSTLFPSPGPAKSSDFDITLLMTLLKNFTLITQPSTGWDAWPLTYDISEGADLVRVKLYRNQIFQSNEAVLADNDFKVLWTNLKYAIDRLSGGTMKKEVDDSESIDLDQTQRDLLLQIIQIVKKLMFHEQEIKDIKEKYGEKFKEMEQKHEEKIRVLKQDLNQAKEYLTQEQNQPVPRNIRVQNTLTIEQWVKDDTVFYETLGYIGALEELENKNYITIVAGPGAGKSAIARHIALKLRNEDWDVVPVDYPEDIVSYGSFDIKQVFVLDDVVGVFSVEMPRIDALSRIEQKILNLIQCQTKLIMTCRTNVCNEAKKYETLVTKVVVDLESVEFRLKEQEKRAILLNHCSSTGIKQDLYENVPLSNAKIMFPLLCKIFCSEHKYQRIGKQFFEKPTECLLQKLRKMKDRNPLHYAVLVLLCLTENSTLSKEIISKSDETFLNLRKTVFDKYGVNHCTPGSDIIKALSLLDGTYTRQSSEGFSFIHDFIFELVAYHHGESNPEQILKHSSSSYVNNRVILDEPLSDDGLYIKLGKQYYQLLGERIFEDIKKLKLYNVFKNSALKNAEFLDVFIKILQKTDLKTVNEIFFRPQPTSKRLDESDETDTSENIEEDETDKYMVRNISILLEEGDIRVIRWIAFYGPFLLLEFIINLAKKPKETRNVKRITTQESSKNDEEQTRLLTIGCYSGDVNIAELILQHVNPSCVNKSLELFYFRFTPFSVACYCGYLPIVNLLIKYGAELDACDMDGNTPLSRASYKGHYDTVTRLIDLDADPNKSGRMGKTPLYIASVRGHYDIIKYLIDHGASPNKPDNFDNTPLYIASARGHFDIVRYLIDHGADPNIPGRYNNTPLIMATRKGHCDIVQYLVEHGADPNIHGSNGYTPLLISSEKGYSDIVGHLTTHGADPNKHSKGYTKYSKGNTPLYIASEKGHCEIVIQLLNHGADPNKHNRHSDTPVTRAASEGHIDIVRHLIDHGADANKIGHRYNTPLYRASEEGYCDIVSLLLDNTRDMNIGNDHFIMPLHIALYTGKMNVVKLIVQHMNKMKTNEGNNQLYHALILLKQKKMNKDKSLQSGVIVYKNTKLSKHVWNIIRLRECAVLLHLIMLGLEVSHSSYRGAPLLYRLIFDEQKFEKKEEKIKVLLEAGVDINMRDDQSKSVTEYTRTKVCKYRNKRGWGDKSLYNAYCNVLNVVKCHLRRYSI